MLTQQDGGGPRESLHARHRRELPPAQRHLMLSHLQRHSHHGQYVIQRLRHKTWGMEKHSHFLSKSQCLTDQIALAIVYTRVFVWQWEEYAINKSALCEIKVPDYFHLRH